MYATTAGAAGWAAGTCGFTRSGGPVDCNAGSSGAWPVEASDWESGRAACAAMCQGCASCAFFSYSLQQRDCSWFASCPRLSGEVSSFRSFAMGSRGQWTHPGPDCASSAPPPIVFCAVVRHTQGSAMYSFLSLLSVAIATKRVLRHRHVAVHVPTATRGFQLSMPFTNSSIAALSRLTGVEIRSALVSSGGGHSECEAPPSDVTIFKGVTVSTALRVRRQIQNALVEHETLQDLYNRRAFDELQGRFAERLLNDLWSFLEQARKLEPCQQGQPSVTGQPIRVTLQMMQGPSEKLARAGVLHHVSAALHSDALVAVNVLDLVPGEARVARQKSCAYVFLRLPVHHGRWVTFSRDAANCTTPYNHQGRFDVQGRLALQIVVTAIVAASRARYVTCARVNAVVQPAYRASFLEHFARVDASFGVRLAHPSDGRPGRPCRPARHQTPPDDCSADATTSTGGGEVPRSRMGQLPWQMHELQQAASAPLLITEFGSHTQDWVGRPHIQLHPTVFPSPPSTIPPWLLPGPRQARHPWVAEHPYCAGASHWQADTANLWPLFLHRLHLLSGSLRPFMAAVHGRGARKMTCARELLNHDRETAPHHTLPPRARAPATPKKAAESGEHRRWRLNSGRTVRT